MELHLGEERLREQSETTSYLACFLLKGDGLLRVFLGFLHIVGRLVDVVFNPVDRFTLQEAPQMTNRTLAQLPYLI